MSGLFSFVSETNQGDRDYFGGLLQGLPVGAKRCNCWAAWGFDGVVGCGDFPVSVYSEAPIQVAGGLMQSRRNRPPFSWIPKS
jgi:hypothetical protein